MPRRSTRFSSTTPPATSARSSSSGSSSIRTRPRFSVALALGLCACSHARPGPGLLTGNIQVEGDPGFRSRTQAALARLEETASGRRLFKSLARSGRSVTVRFGHLDLSGATTIPIGDGDSVVVWDPGNDLPAFPAFLGLYHELVHALHMAEGVFSDKDEEELRTIGAGRFASADISENALRRELGLPPRTEHESVEAWMRAHGH